MISNTKSAGVFDILLANYHVRHHNVTAMASLISVITFAKMDTSH